jgi:hypothetical protein
LTALCHLDLAPSAAGHWLPRASVSLANEAGVTGVGPHPLVQVVPKLPGSTDVVLTGRATTVPFAAVATGSERTTMDNATVATTCAISYLAR